MPQAKGTFEVKIVPQPPDPKAETQDSIVGRMSLDKQFHGDLEATGKGQMLTAGTPSGSGVYVAIERVTGTLHGRNGSFVLHHTGIMTRGQPQMTIAVVPDSGTDELAGLSGNLSIEIVDGKHFYDLDYTLTDVP
jgi:Protein of unknown function (DUF3224)